MALCSERGRFLFEVRPDLFPERMLTRTETELWGFWYEERSRRNSHNR
jgi:hypothetical protein